MNQVLLFPEPCLEKVSERIGRHVLNFFRSIGKDHCFQGSLLCKYVWEHEECAPESPGRIMRQLRLDGVIDYEVMNRAKALYRILEVT